jgi:hypothetical protein
VWIDSTCSIGGPAKGFCNAVVYKMLGDISGLENRECGHGDPLW